MNLRSNAHCHTIYCDGANTPEEMIQAALDRDFLSLGFSIHGWTPYELCGVTQESEAAYRTELKRLQQKYAGQIEILIGAERDSQYQRDFSAYEYLIDSAHWFEKDGELLCMDYSEERFLDNVNRHFGGDFYAYTRAYFAEVARMCSAADGAFIGHIDLVAKFNEGYKYFDETDPRYLKPALEAVECAVSRNLPLEMNTGAISRGYRIAPYPASTLLKAIHDLGGEIIINSDAHSAAGLDMAFDLCQDLAKAAGFKRVLRLRKGGMEEVGLG